MECGFGENNENYNPFSCGLEQTKKKKIGDGL
ncbi:MAG: hypothetical protein BWY32_00567 [bacterium ADurb.Bin243]|nr:MAG: hypothetical protein BWY32_00567 [bacterium ADurb.Bin243]